MEENEGRKKKEERKKEKTRRKGKKEIKSRKQQKGKIIRNKLVFMFSAQSLYTALKRGRG